MRSQSVLPLVLGITLAMGCSSSARNTQATGGTSGSGGSAGTGGMGGGMGGSGAAGGVGGTGAGSGVPLVVDVHSAAVTGDQFAAAVDLSAVSGNVFLLAYGAYASAAKSVLVEFAPQQSDEVTRREYPSSGETYLTALTVGGTGALHVSGMFAKEQTFGQTTLTETSGFGAAVARILPGSTDTVTAYGYTGNGIQALRGNARFSNGIVSVGEVQNTTTVHGTSIVADAEGDALLSVEFNGTTIPHALLAGPGRQGLSAVTTTPESDVVVVGDALAGDPVTVLGTGAANQVAIVARYDPTLELKWALGVGSGANDSFSSVAYSAVNDDIIAAGWSAGPVDLGNGIAVGHEGGDDILVVCFTATGVPRWAKAFGGGANDRAYAVGVANAGDIFVAGSVTSANIVLGSEQLTKQGPQDGFLLRLDAEGSLRFAALFGGPGSDTFGAIAVRQDQVLLAGRFQDAFTFLGTPLSGPTAGANEFDLVVLTLSP